jgi:hypothetical protein
VDFPQQLDQVQECVGAMVIGVAFGGGVVARIWLAGRTHAPHMSVMLVQQLPAQTVDALGDGFGLEVVLIHLVCDGVDVEGLRDFEILGGVFVQSAPPTSYTTEELKHSHSLNDSDEQLTLPPGAFVV